MQQKPVLSSGIQRRHGKSFPLCGSMRRQPSLGRTSFRKRLSLPAYGAGNRKLLHVPSQWRRTPVLSVLFISIWTQLYHLPERKYLASGRNSDGDNFGRSCEHVKSRLPCSRDSLLKLHFSKISLQSWCEAYCRNPPAFSSPPPSATAAALSESHSG